MANDVVFDKFGIHEVSKGAATMLGAVISKFGSHIDKRVTMSNLVNKGKNAPKDPAAAKGFNRLGLANKGIDDDLKVE